MNNTRIADSLTQAQLNSLNRIRNDGLSNVSQKHLAVAEQLIDIVCDAAKTEDGGYNPLMIQLTQLRNILDDCSCTDKVVSIHSVE